MTSDMRLGIDVDTDTRVTRSEFSQLAREIKRHAEAMGIDLEDAVEQWEQQARESGREVRTDVLEAMRRIAQQGPSDLDKVRAGFRELGDEARDAGDDMRAIGDGVQDGAREASEGLRDVKDEARDSAREAAASFSGEFDDVGDFVQEVLANAFAALGPIGAAAGIAAAIGFGTLKTKIDEDAQAAEERVQAMYDDMLESGNAFLSKSAIQDAVAEIVKDNQRFADAQGLAAAAGRDLETVLLALAGDADALASVQSGLSGEIDRLNSSIDESQTEVLGLNAGTVEARNNAERWRDQLQGTSRDLETQAGRADLTRRALARIPAEVDTDVNVSDNGSVRTTQQAIDRMHGKSLPVRVYADQQSIDQLYNTVDGIRLPAKVVQVRYGQAAV